MRLRFAACLVALAMPVPAGAATLAGIPLSGSVGLSTDYLYHGISQTGSTGAWLADLTWGGSAGAYLYAGGARVRYPGSGAFAEIDLAAGWQQHVAGWHFDGGLEFVFYPDANSFDLDYAALYLAVTKEWSWATLEVSLGASPEFSNHSGAWVSADLEGEFPIGERLAAIGQLGYQVTADPKAYGLPAYFDGKAGLRYEVSDLRFEAALSWTSVPHRLCPDGRCDPRVTISTVWRY
jgi:uncharacterized protein (TIGR02001 family)